MKITKNSAVKKIFLCMAIAVFLLTSCKNEAEKPKVSYDNAAKTKQKTIVADTTKIDISDLPVQFAGTKFLLFPIGKITTSNSDKSNSRIESDDNTNFKISNNNDDEITGFLTNLKFQDIEKDTITTLSDKKISIQSITFLKEFATKTKQQILVYTLEDTDTNKDGTIDANDINTLYISDIAGTRFTKITKAFHELIDWQIIISTNRLYFRTIEDTNKNGLFDKGDKIKYQYLDLLSTDWKISEYNPI